MEVLTLAQELANRYYERAAYDSAQQYFQVATAVFRKAGFDSTAPAVLTRLPSTRLFTGSAELAATVASTGLASRRLGDVPGALRAYERAEALYRRQGNLGGEVWAQGLVGEAYADQGDLPRAAQVYERALASARTYARQDPEGSPALAGLLLDYYLPLLLDEPRQWPYAAQLATEATAALG
jgi:tetratricopeptide (TPR) repeat protein